MLKLAKFLTKWDSALFANRNVKIIPISIKRCYSSEKESDEEKDKRMLEFFKRPDIDGWWVRKGLQELHDTDAVPEPEIIIAAFRAIRKVNDFALAIRFLECTYEKCGSQKKRIWPYIMQEIQPTLTELGIPNLEEIGYDKPELACFDPETDRRFFGI